VNDKTIDALSEDGARLLLDDVLTSVVRTMVDENVGTEDEVKNLLAGIVCDLNDMDLDEAFGPDGWVSYFGLED